MYQVVDAISFKSNLKLNEASSSGGALYTLGDIAIDTSVIIEILHNRAMLAEANSVAMLLF